MSQRKDRSGINALAFLVGVWVVIGLAMCSAGCAAALAHRPQAQSWDQANLKQNDYGCPTAIFVAPGGNLVQCQRAADLPGTITVVHAPAAFDTIEQAAIAGLRAIAAKSTSSYYEWGGVIVRTPDGKYSALAPNTSLAGDHVQIQSDNFITNGTPVADYHTHPCLPEHYVEYFSPPDLFSAIFFHTYVFMGDFCTGNVHEFKPGDKPDAEHPDDHGHIGEVFITKGRIIGQFTAPHTLAVVQ